MGLSKAGLKGTGILCVTILAIAQGPKASVGILLPILIFGDILAVFFYNKHVKWKYLLKFLPLMILGVLAGAWIGKHLSEELFKMIMSIIILLSTLMMLFWDRYNKKIPNNLAFAGSMGFGAGFTTMIGNMAGAFSNIFFLALRIPKNVFIGTSAWLFFIINLVKMPIHIFYWKTIDFQTLWIDLYLLPAAAIGFFIGLKIVERLSEFDFRKFILIMTALGAVFMLLK